ncbi:MAG: type VI secretion system tube protein Hcp [Chitinophagales bacterium]|nr:type VI secretion system tube protein Hcp [Chitinophagales bacterium]
MKFTIHSLLFLFLAIPFTSFAQDIIYMEVREENSGVQITQGAGTLESIGLLSSQSHPNESYVVAMEFTNKHDIDPNTGAILGDAIPCILKVKKVIDKASPELFSALINKAPLQVTLKFWRQSYQTGNPEHYYTIQFTGAKMVSLRQLKQETSTANFGLTDFEEISFTYSTIEITHETAGPVFNHSY